MSSVNDLQSFYRTARIRGVAATVLTLLLPLSAGSATSTRRGNAILKLVAAEFSTPGRGGVVLVARGSNVIFRRAFGQADLELGVPMNPLHVLGTGSITKQFTAVAILQLVEQGRISLGDDVRKHEPTFDTQGRMITVEQVLTHTSGLPSFVDRDDFAVIARQDYSVERLLALSKGMPHHFEPGQGYYYSDSGYILLGSIIERVSGVSYADYIEKKLLRPLGITSTWYADDYRVIPHRAKGYSLRGKSFVRAEPISMTVPHAAGAIFSTVDDLLKWHRALRAGRIISRKLLQRAWTTRPLPNGTHSGYGFGWKMCTLAGARTIEHGGFVNGFSANVLYLPDHDTTVIVLVNNDGDSPDAGVVARRIGRQVVTGSSDVPRYTLSERQRAALVGRYQEADGKLRTIADRRGSLVLERPAAEARPLFALSPTQLSLTENDDSYVMLFTLNSTGRAMSFGASLRCEAPNVTAVRALE